MNPDKTPSSGSAASATALDADQLSLVTGGAATDFLPLLPGAEIGMWAAPGPTSPIGPLVPVPVVARDPPLAGLPDPLIFALAD